MTGLTLKIILSSFLLVGASEMGDKTQLLAFSLAARFKRPWPVLAGIFVATIVNHTLASSVGRFVSAEISPRTLSILLAVIFIAFGFWTLKPDTLPEADAKPKAGPFLTTLILFFLAEMGIRLNSQPLPWRLSFTPYFGLRWARP